MHSQPSVARTLELEASAPYPTLIPQTLVPPKDAWPVQQLMESKAGEGSGGNTGGGIGGEAAGGGIEAEAAGGGIEAEAPGSGIDAEPDEEARFLRRKSAILRFASATHN